MIPSRTRRRRAAAAIIVASTLAAACMRATPEPTAARSGAPASAVAGEDSRLYNGDKIRMTDVTALPDGGFLAVGNYVGVQYETAASWTSADGLAWRRAPRYAALEQGEMLAVAIGPSDLISVGSFGAPDNYIPAIWLSPLPNGG